MCSWSLNSWILHLYQKTSYCNNPRPSEYNLKPLFLLFVLRLLLLLVLRLLLRLLLFVIPFAKLFLLFLFIWMNMIITFYFKFEMYNSYFCHRRRGRRSPPAHSECRSFLYCFKDSLT